MQPSLHKPPFRTTFNCNRLLLASFTLWQHLNGFSSYRSAPAG